MNGKTVGPGKLYRMAIHNFMAAGGDGYPVVRGHPSFINTGFVNTEVMPTYLIQHSPLSVSDYQPCQTVRLK